MAERPVVPKKPSNVGGGKGPQLKTDARSNEGQGIDDESSRPEPCSGVADSVTCSMLRAMKRVSFPRAGCVMWSSHLCGVEPVRARLFRRYE